MAYTISVRTGISGTGISSQSATISLTADSVDNRQITVPAGEDLLVELVATLSRVVAYSFQSDKAVTLETNSSVGTGTAGDTIVLAANQPAAWYDGCGLAKHFTADITSLYVSNFGTTAATLNICIAKDGTP